MDMEHGESRVQDIVPNEQAGNSHGVRTAEIVDNSDVIEISEKDDALGNNLNLESAGGHRPTRGGELIPYTPLSQSHANTIGLFAVLSTATGTVVTLMGVLVHGLMIKYAAKQGPVLWWTGFGPFVLGLIGIKAASSRSRRKTYAWGISIVLLSVTQTAIMGWVGNFTTSHYDVWPLHATRNDVPVCVMMDFKCYCQDYYQGVYSTMVLPGVEYLYKDDVKWRATVFDTCGHLGAITALFWSFHVAWILFFLSSIASCCLGIAGSICARQDEPDFQQLKEDDEEEHIDTRQLEEECEENAIGDGRLEVVYSEFERY